MKPIIYKDKQCAVFEKIQIEDGWVIVDKEAEMFKGDFAYDIEADNLITECLRTDKNSYWNKNSEIKKIISASKSLIDKYQMTNVYEFISKEEQEIEKLALEVYPISPFYDGDELRHHDTNDELREGFIKGLKYKANQNKFSEKQILEWYESMRTQDWKEPSDYFKQKEVYLEVEEIDRVTTFVNEGIYPKQDWQLKRKDNKVHEI